MSGPLRIDPVQRATLGSIVTDQLRDLVVHGRYQPGALLSEVELAEGFGVSRGPVREALQRLVSEGLLRRDPRRGVSVPVPSDADIADLYLARQAIEGAAIRAVMTDGAADIVADLRETVARMRAAVGADDWVTVADLDMAFHSRLVNAAGSPRLSRLYAGLLAETRACLAMTARYPGREDLVAEHDELAGLLGSGDVPGLLAALARHFTESIDTLARYRLTPVRRPVAARHGPTPRQAKTR